MAALKKIYLALRKRAYLSLGSRYVVRRRLGGLFLLDMVNHIDRQIEAFGTYEGSQIAHLLRLIEANKCDIFIDAGAHWGYYSLAVALDSKIKDVKIIAFEPDPVNRGQFWANIFLNRLQNRIEVRGEALSDQVGFAAFKCYDDENRGRSALAQTGSLKIAINKLDALIESCDRTIAIKIDTEGHELNVIRGAKNLLVKNCCVIQVESFGNKAQELRELLARLGYKLVRTIGNDHYYSNIKALMT